MKTNFSFHAYKRGHGRLSMTHSALAEILDMDLAINIGNESNNNRVHKLFYSEHDNMCFVAIQDIKVGTVITVLPIDYHENISWAVSIESQSQAKKLIVKDEAPFINESQILNTNASVFRISANIADDYGRYITTVNIGSWPCEPYEYSIDTLIDDLVSRINKKRPVNKDIEEFIYTIAIRLGRKGEPVYFSTSDIIANTSA